ncbi:ABC transporter permease [Beggiatoa leptomitoformis]|nr:MlaE family lipid ABC transporter permease subunit [Beggiatoa leptomitoformis]
MMMPEEVTTANITLTGETLQCQGDWTLNGLGKLETTLSKLTLPTLSQVTIDGQAIQNLDTAGAWLLCRLQAQLSTTGKIVEFANFHPEQQKLLSLTTQHIQDKIVTPTVEQVLFLEYIGRQVWRAVEEVYHFLAFVGEVTICMWHALLLPYRIRWQAVFSTLYNSGVTALPIVGLMSFLMGIVIAYQGGQQLKIYGANILVVNLVGVTLLRVLSPLLTAIMVAGRSGSAYAAQIGTMRVTSEIDALRTLGISPLDLLVIPKIIALVIALPLLTAYADIMGLLGGMLIAQLALDVSFSDFIERLPQAVPIYHYLIGIGKTVVYAVIIAIVGCYQGFQTQGGADSVGRQVTISVVHAIFLVMFAEAIFSVIFSWVGI